MKKETGDQIESPSRGRVLISTKTSHTDRKES